MKVVYTQPYFGKHWKNNDPFSIISIGHLKFSQTSQTLLHIQLLLIHLKQTKFQPPNPRSSLAITFLLHTYKQTSPFQNL